MNPFRGDLHHSVTLSTVAVALIFWSGCGEQTLPEVDAYQQHEEALRQGDQQQALTHLSESIAAKPTFFAYRARAHLHLEMGNVQAAIADCQQGLELDPENSDLKWLLEETGKPESQRLQTQPPSASK